MQERMAQLPLLIARRGNLPVLSQRRNVEARFNVLVVQRDVADLGRYEDMLNVSTPVNWSEPWADPYAFEKLLLL